MPLYRAPLLGICSRGCEQAQDGAGGGGDYIREKKKKKKSSTRLGTHLKAAELLLNHKTAGTAQVLTAPKGVSGGGEGRREGGPTLNSVKAHTARS